MKTIHQLNNLVQMWTETELSGKEMTRKLPLSISRKKNALSWYYTSRDFSEELQKKNITLLHGKLQKKKTSAIQSTVFRED